MTKSELHDNDKSRLEIASVILSTFSKGTEVGSTFDRISYNRARKLRKKQHGRIGLEPATARTSVKHLTDWANQKILRNNWIRNVWKFSYEFFMLEKRRRKRNFSNPNLRQLHSLSSIRTCLKNLEKKVEIDDWITLFNGLDWRSAKIIW